MEALDDHIYELITLNPQGASESLLDFDSLQEMTKDKVKSLIDSVQEIKKKQTQIV